MLASFVMSFHSRRIDNVTQVVRFLKHYHSDVIAKSEIIFLCQDQCGCIDTGFAESHMVNLRLDCMQKCKAINHGVHIAKAEKIILIDSDRILPAGYYNQVLNDLTPDKAITARITHRLLQPVGDADIFSANYSYIEEHRSESNQPYARNLFAGNVAFFKSTFFSVGGMDESYIGYGFEDSDMTMKIIHSGVKPIFRPEIELHLYHEPMTYGHQDQKVLFLKNGIRYCKNWNIPIPATLQEEINEYTGRLL